MITEEWLQNHLNTLVMSGIVKLNSRHIKCNNGTVISVQAGKNWYSLPKDDIGPYTHVEYCFIDDNITNVYGYIPIDKVVKLINNSGGVSSS